MPNHSAESLWLPPEIWERIAHFLENQDLGKFRQISKVTHWVGSHTVILRPLYHRLYALDNTLPPELPQENAPLAFKQAFKKIQARQKDEITYLTQHHPALMAKPEYRQVFEENTAVSLKSLEARNTILDKINSEIIKPQININGIHLNLERIRITRLPVTLFHEPAYVNFWQDLTQLNCSDNQLTTLNVQELTALKGLECFGNQLTALNVQGLTALKRLLCSSNQLTKLNVQGLTALQRLDCISNQLTALNFQGLTALEWLCCSYNQLTALNVQGLTALQQLSCDHNHLTTLNVQGLTALQQLSCDHNHLTTLNVQGLTALQRLWCFNNHLTALNVQGLTALQILICHYNHLTELNVQELSSLETLDFNDNPLETLNLTGVPAKIQKKYAELERNLLLKQSIRPTFSILTPAHPFLPSFGVNNHASNESLWLPEITWTIIAHFLDNQDLAKFIQLSKVTPWVGSDATILRTLYNRLYALDNTLPPLLPYENIQLAFKKMFEEIQVRQQAEITYLTHHHPARMAKFEYRHVFEENTTLLLKSLEARNRVLDKINSEIITLKINVHRTELNLQAIRITRLPVTLFHEPAYVHFWQNLIHLNCGHNQLTSLNVQGLTTLQILSCHNNQLTSLNVKELTMLQDLTCVNNQLTTLNVQGLMALRRLHCSNNQLTTLNVQGLMALDELSCENKPLKELNLTGVPARIKDKYAELERNLLFSELRQSDSFEARQQIIARLGTDYTYKNCLYYCGPVYAATLFALDSVNSACGLVSGALTRASAYLPSFGERNNTAENTELKRKPDEEEPEGRPDVKKNKKN